MKSDAISRLRHWREMNISGTAIYRGKTLIEFSTLRNDCILNLQSNSYFSVLHRIFYIATPKAACTTFKWWFADLIDKSDAVFGAHGSNESSPDLVIHDLLGRVSPNSTGLSIEKLNFIINASDYFRFCLVRNPFSRIFSAWQSKWLLREPLQVGPYRNYPFFNLPIRNILDVAMAFEAFLECLKKFEYPNILDPHVKSQFSLLSPDLIPYSIISKLEDSSKLCADLELHLGAAYKSPFSFGKRNESLIAYHSNLVTDRSEALIREMYAVDFDYFGYATSKPLTTIGLDENVLRVALSAVEMLRGRHQRTDEMRSEYKTQIENTQKDLSELQKVIDQQHNNFINLEQMQHKSREEIVRAEAQLMLLKDLLLSDGKFERI
jgi:hypothetical protein